MTVRQKITLLITAAGFLSSLVFSCIILWEMIGQPFRIIDSEIETTANWIVKSFLHGDPIQEASLLVDEDRYWLRMYDLHTDQLLYQSLLAAQIDIPEPELGLRTTVSVIIPAERINLGQDIGNEVTFRMRNFKISLEGRTFRVVAGRPMERLEEELWDIFIGVASGLAFSVLLLMTISYFLAGFILKPVKIINDQARDISEKHLDRRIPVTSDRDEFNTLAQTLNQVFDHLQHAFLQQKRLFTDASHELKTPLTMMRLSVDELRSAYDDDPSCSQAEKLVRMTEQVLRMERLVKNLLDLSSLEIEGIPTEESIDLDRLLASLIVDYQLLMDTHTIHIETHLSRRLPVKGNMEKLRRAFSNILDNAIKYNVESGRIEVTSELSDAELTIAVTNTGPGVAEDEISKVFDQFYRGEKSRSLRYGGSGLGLAIVKRIIELHGGTVKFESQQGSWTRVTVTLPQYGKEPDMNPSFP